MSTKISIPHTEEDVKKLKIADLRRYAIRISQNLDEILNLKKLYCHGCDDWHLATNFYADRRYKSGFYPICKECLQKQAMDYNKSTGEFKDNREKTIKVFQKLDLPFIDSVYKQALRRAQEEGGERNRKSGYGHLLTMVKTLEQYRNLHFEDSEYGMDGDPAIKDTEEEINENSRVIKSAKKRFGPDYSNKDLMFLETQYEDWTSRYACESKAQELLFQRICHKQLEIEKAQRSGAETKDLDKTLQDLMNASNLQPKQNVANASMEGLTFGQLIEKWEQEEPIPEPDPELSDVSNIGKNLRVWFAGWLGYALGLNIPQTQEYVEEVEKYKVTKPEEKTNEISTSIYNQLYGKQGE